LAALAIVAAISFAAPDTCAREDPRLVKLGALNFPNLTPAERALLAFAERSNTSRGKFAIAGSSDAPLDPSNDPAHADEWAHDRDVRADLIRWLAVDNGANSLVDPSGVRLLGARIVGPVDLSHVKVPFAITLVRCSIPQPMVLESTDLPYLDLSGSYTGSIHAPNLTVHGDLNLGSVEDSSSPKSAPFNASGTVSFESAKIRGSANFGGGHFHYVEKEARAAAKPLRLALYMSGSEVTDNVQLCCGFESDGCTFMDENSIGGDFDCYGGRFVNPGNVALTASVNEIKGVVFLGPNPQFVPESFGFESDGLVRFDKTRVGSFFIVEHAKFGGKVQDRHGLFALGLNVGFIMSWHNIDLENGATLDLSGANVSWLFDEERSWPSPGKLRIDGFTYGALGGSSSYESWRSPTDAASRLRWLALQPGFYPQPYRQLAKILSESGDDAGAMKVLIAKQDLRFASFGIPGRLLGNLLKYTVGYGHHPMLTIMWSALVVLLGWGLVRIGNRAGVMRRTYPENTPAPAADRYEDLYPLLYSLDVFLPFVNLHQEHYWWPDGRATGEVTMLGGRVPVRGSLLRSYLWLQIIAGWILSAIFVAGVTGLIKGD